MDTTLLDVLMLTRAEVGPAPDATVVPLSPQAHVEPLSAFVGVPGEGGLMVEGHGGVRSVLHVHELALVDALDEPSDVGPLIERARAAVEEGPSDEELARRLRALADLHLVRVTYEPLIDDETEDDLAPPPPKPPVRRALRALVPRTQFPGRTALRRAYRRIRPLPHQRPAFVDPAQEGYPDGEPTTPGAVEPAAPEDAAEHTSPCSRYLEPPRVGPEVAGRIPVYALFQVETGPPLSLGMLTAAARNHEEGALNQTYEIRRMEEASSVLADLGTRPGPAVLLLSNYLWSVEQNLETARAAKALNPELLCVHGGPSTPQYEADLERFFVEHDDVVDVAVRSEGEITLCELLQALAPGLPTWDLGLLQGLAGLTFRDPATGAFVRTEDRDRVRDLSILPSPYLTGEFDHLHPQLWSEAYLILETNRGCPYGCTFCDWGSSTLSRIRKFDVERVVDEMRWAGERGMQTWVLADANVGIMSRDVDIAERMAEVKAVAGVPTILGFNVAKNTTKHLTAIMDRLVAANIAPHVSLALQTRDEGTLEAVRRTNISTDHYVAMAANFRRHGLPLQADIMLGLPGQTLESLAGDLQFLIDHEVPARIWITQLLPNSPMNDPAYREEWGIRSDANGVVIETSTFDADDRAEMMRLRFAHTVLERFGLFRHLGRYLQWDHGIPITELMRQALDHSARRPNRYPLLTWVLSYFDYFQVPPLGWASFYAEMRRFVHDELGVPPSSGLDTVLAIQEFLLPELGRKLPDDLVLEHDYVQYYRDATRSLWDEGHATGAIRPLEDYGTGRLTVYGDPMRRCERRMATTLDPRNETMTEAFWSSGHMELDSPLVVPYAEIVADGGFIGLHEQVPADVDVDAPAPVVERRNAIPVQLASRRTEGEG